VAAKANNAALVAELIGRGGNVNAKDPIQDSAFLFAGAEGLNDVLQLTLAAGADVTSINRYGGTALIPASEHGHVETLKVLIAAGVPVNHVNNLGWTAMQEAILLNNGGQRQQEVVRLLLAAGADPGIRDPEGRTALQNAERLGFSEIAASMVWAAALSPRSKAWTVPKRSTRATVTNGSLSAWHFASAAVTAWAEAPAAMRFCCTTVSGAGWTSTAGTTTGASVVPAVPALAAAVAPAVIRRAPAAAAARALVDFFKVFP
jgi:hypothetical protein